MSSLHLLFKMPDKDKGTVAFQGLDWTYPCCPETVLFDEDGAFIEEEPYCDACQDTGSLLDGLLSWGFGETEVEDILYVQPAACHDRAAPLAAVNTTRRRVADTLEHILSTRELIRRRDNSPNNWNDASTWLKFHALRKAFNAEWFCGYDEQGAIWIVRVGLKRFRVCRKTADAHGHELWEFVDGAFENFKQECHHPHRRRASTVGVDFVRLPSRRIPPLGWESSF